MRFLFLNSIPYGSSKSWNDQIWSYRYPILCRRRLDKYWQNGHRSCSGISFSFLASTIETITSFNGLVWLDRAHNHRLRFIHGTFDAWPFGPSLFLTGRVGWRSVKPSCLLFPHFFGNLLTSFYQIWWQTAIPRTSVMPPRPSPKACNFA